MKVMKTVLAKRASKRMLTAPESERERLLAMAQGLDDVIMLGRGDPDLETPPHIIEAAVKALRNGYTHYTHWAGMLELRQAISDKLKRDNRLVYNPDTEIVVTTGLQEAIYVIFQGLLNPDDEVLIADPLYMSYDRAVKFAGGKTVFIPTYEQDNYALKPDIILEHITHRSKVLVLVSPNNPTGAIIPVKTLEAIADIAKDKDLLIISDEIYEKLIYDGSKHISIASFPDMHERTIVLNGFSKAYSMTGWRIGYMAAPADFIKKIQILKHGLTISVNHAAQAGAIAALTGGEGCIHQTVEIYRERLNFLMSQLDTMGLTYGRPSGGMYIFANITSAHRTSGEFCRDLLMDSHVLLFPGTAFGNAEGYVRIPCLIPIEQMRIAAQRMGDVVRDYISNDRSRTNGGG